MLCTALHDDDDPRLLGDRVVRAVAQPFIDERRRPHGHGERRHRAHRRPGRRPRPAPPGRRHRHVPGQGRRQELLPGVLPLAAGPGRRQPRPRGGAARGPRARPSSSSSTSRSSRSRTAACAASRPSCAGTTRPGGSSRRSSSCPSPRNAASSPGSTRSSSTRPAASSPPGSPRGAGGTGFTMAVNISGRQLIDPGFAASRRQGRSPPRPRPLPALPRDHRDDPQRRGRRRRGDARRALRAGRPPRHRRLRDRLLDPRPPPAAPGRHLEDRPQLHRADRPHGPGREIIAAITAMSHALGMAVVGEGIETGEQFDELASLDCDGARASSSPPRSRPTPSPGSGAAGPRSPGRRPLGRSPAGWTPLRLARCRSRSHRIPQYPDSANSADDRRRRIPSPPICKNAILHLREGVARDETAQESLPSLSEVEILDGFETSTPIDGTSRIGLVYEPNATPSASSALLGRSRAVSSASPSAAVSSAPIVTRDHTLPRAFSPSSSKMPGSATTRRTDRAMP